MSPRTLKRKLAEHGTTFSAIRDDIRRQRALLLLDNRALSIGEIAARARLQRAAELHARVPQVDGHDAPGLPRVDRHSVTPGCQVVATARTISSVAVAIASP